MTLTLMTQYDYIPQKIYVGKFTKAKLHADCGFVTCKYKEMKWTGENIFTRLTGGFAPHSQRDAEVELTKTINAAVTDLDNMPISGFKLVPSTEYDFHDIYGIQEFRNSNNMLVEDPRGFIIAISRRELFSILEQNGCNIKDGVIEGKFCYAFTSYSSRALLISGDDEHYAEVKAKSDDVIEQHKCKVHVMPSKLVPGKVYRADMNKLPKGLYVYLGKHDVYSTNLQENAYRHKSYEHIEEERVKRSNDITGKMRNVLYYLGDDTKDFARCTAETYVMKSNVSKMLLECDDDVDLTKLKMPDCPGSDCTYESICNDMKHNALFNKISFKSVPRLVKMPFELFSALFDRTTSSSNDIFADLRFYPFWLYSSTYFYTSTGKIQFIAQMPERQTMSYTKRYRVAEMRTETKQSFYSSYYRSGKVWETTVDRDFDSFRDFYDAVQPYMADIELENGELMKPEHACYFAKASANDFLI